MFKKALFAVGFHLLSQSQAIEPPRELCPLLLAMGASAKQVRDYFAPSKGHVYEEVRPELRQRLIESSRALMTNFDPEGNARFAGENWGPTGVAHLWLLGVSPTDIKNYTEPLVAAYMKDRVMPGLNLLRQGKEFRDLTDTVGLPEVTEPGGLVFIRNNRFVSGEDSPFARALLTARDRHEIDSAFSETVPGILHYHFEGALLAGDLGNSATILEYMMRLDPSDRETIYALNTLNRQKDLLLVGEKLAFEASQRLGQGDASFKTRNLLYGAIDALSLVREEPHKTRAAEILISIGNLYASDKFLASFGLTKPEEIADQHQENYDLALRALLATGHIASRRYIDSVSIENIIDNIPNPHVVAEIQRICDRYVQFEHRMAESHFVTVRAALRAIKDYDRLKRYGQTFFDKRAKFRSDWNPDNVYDSAFEFFMAGEDVPSAQQVVLAWSKDFKFGPVNREDRTVLDRMDVEVSLAEAAFRAGHTQVLLHLLDISKEQGWGTTATRISDWLNGETPRTPHEVFAHLPEIPDGIRSVLAEDLQVTEWFRNSERPSVADRSVLIDRGRLAMQSGDYDAAFQDFKDARYPEGLIELGDAYMAIYRDPRSNMRWEAGSTAQGAYFAAAVLEREEKKEGR